MTMRRKWSVLRVYSPYSPRSSKSLEGRYRLRFTAWLVARQYPPNQASIVNHDDEMRRWGRPDWITYPTEEEKAAAAALWRSGAIIPSVAPGASIVVDLGGRG